METANAILSAARAAKQEALDGWWATERARRQRLRELFGRARKGLEEQARQRRLERKRRLQTLVDAVAGAQVAAAEEERRKTLRLGAEVARTRALGRVESARHTKVFSHQRGVNVFDARGCNRGHRPLYEGACSDDSVTLFVRGGFLFCIF